MKLISCILLLLIILSSPAHAQSIETDPMVKELQQELDYNFKQLQHQKIPAYFLSLRMADEHVTFIESDMGAASSSIQHYRTVTPLVRIGDMSFDNYKFVNQGTADPSGRNAQGVGVPLDGRPLSAVRQATWEATLSRYDIAQKNYAAAKSKVMTSADNEDKAPCFSSAPVARYYEDELPASTYSVDVSAWKKRLNGVALVFKDAGCLETGNINVTFRVIRTWFINSEGSVVVQNRQSARVMLTASIKAVDGMVCPLAQDFFAFTEDKLPSVDRMKQVARDMVTRLKALREAPVADPYSGPAILSGSASGVFFHEIFGHRLEGHRLKAGGETFKKKVGQRVLPGTFQVYCDPTMTRYNNTDLNGHYVYDDEGVKARRVNNVVNGVLRNFLMSRVPLDGFPESNGHGRSRDGNDPVSRQSNLVVETAHPYTEAQLRDMLIAEAKRQGKEYGYYFRTVTSGYTLTGEGNSLNSFNVSPVEVYRVYTDGRRDELVRGVDLIGTPLSMFSNIVAAGDTPSTFTGECGAESGWVPVSATSPMIFVSQIETQRSKAQRQIPMILPAPSQAGKMASAQEEDKILHQAMVDEIKRTTAMSISNLPKPYFIDYRIARIKKIFVKSILGGTVIYANEPLRSVGSVNLLIGNDKLDSETNVGQAITLKLADEVDYDDLRRQLWKSSDMMYKYSVGSYNSKRSYLMQYPRKPQDKNVPEQIASPAVSYSAPSVLNDMIDGTALKKMADSLSGVFSAYPELYGTYVTINSETGDAYRLTNEDTDLRLPIGCVAIEAHASVKCADGSEKEDTWRKIYDLHVSQSEMPALKASIRQFAERLNSYRNADSVEEYYSGPVLFEDEAVAMSFANNVISPILLARRSIEEGSGVNSMMVGKRILDSRINISQLGTVKRYNGIDLIGEYDLDADGRKPASVQLVSNGILQQILCGRHPAASASVPTGNERFLDEVSKGLFTHAAPGIIRVYANKPQKQNVMRKVLAKEAKKSGLDYAYIVKAIDGGQPALYRYDCNTSRETLLRAKEVPLAVKTEMMHLTGVSAEETVSNILLDNNKVSLICPKSMIVDNIEFNFETPVSLQPFAVANPNDK